MDTRVKLALACLLIRAKSYSLSWINSITANYYYRTLLALILPLSLSALLTASRPI